MSRFSNRLATVIALVILTIICTAPAQAEEEQSESKSKWEHNINYWLNAGYGTYNYSERTAIPLLFPDGPFVSGGVQALSQREIGRGWTFKSELVLIGEEYEGTEADETRRKLPYYGNFSLQKGDVSGTLGDWRNFIGLLNDSFMMRLDGLSYPLLYDSFNGPVIRGVKASVDRDKWRLDLGYGWRRWDITASPAPGGVGSLLAEINTEDVFMARLTLKPVDTLGVSLNYNQSTTPIIFALLGDEGVVDAYTLGIEWSPNTRYDRLTLQVEIDDATLDVDFSPLFRGRWVSKKQVGYLRGIWQQGGWTLSGFIEVWRTTQAEKTANLITTEYVWPMRRLILDVERALPNGFSLALEAGWAESQEPILIPSPQGISHFGGDWTTGDQWQVALRWRR